MIVTKPLTDTQCEEEDAEANVQPEKKDGVGHFAEQEHVANVLLQGDCRCGRGRKKKLIQGQ